jgi:D-glycero-alpha-D-manno-heptose-7-phosphate kinase
MIITKTPYRVSFFGGGTDYPEWFEDNGGAVISTSIQHYCYIHGRYLPSFFDYKYRLVWSKIENVSHIDDIEHPVIREALRWKGEGLGMEIHHHGDLPARSGLGSSSSFSVGIINMLYALYGTIESKKKISEDAIYLERVLLKESVGIQDQIAATYGGFNRVDFSKKGNVTINPLLNKETIKELESRILLVYTGVSRISSNFAKKQIESIPVNVTKMEEIRDLVDVATEILYKGGSLDDFGILLHETWMLKKSLTNIISSYYIDTIYNNAISSGALGGKLLGAGGGGFMIFYVPLEKRQAVIKRLRGLLMVPFKVDYEGTQVIFKDSIL